MFKTGLVSISFRGETPESIVRACADCRLERIEWGGDVHVPPGEIKRAREVGVMTREHGLDVAAYGSYYKIGKDSPDTFQRVLDAASALGADVVRVWGGEEGSAEISPDGYARLLADAARAADEAADRGITLALECHLGTITDAYDAALRFLRDCGRPALKMLWQPNHMRDEAYNLKSVAALREYVVNLHVFHWAPQKRLPLCEGAAVWGRYLRMFRETGRDMSLLLEFMHDDKFSSLAETAKALHALADTVNREA
ncbi:MAG: sugar phosphate isomerase/epimerase [Clostridiales bacterium]|jgi:sugar phosphate isomerase/epimerase|nr:sugar phosphate isomerase/epimerase [Clostridiales bacterium]